MNKRGRKKNSQSINNKEDQNENKNEIQDTKSSDISKGGKRNFKTIKDISQKENSNSRKLGRRDYKEIERENTRDRSTSKSKSRLDSGEKNLSLNSNETKSRITSLSPRSRTKKSRTMVDAVRTSKSFTKGVKGRTRSGRASR